MVVAAHQIHFMPGLRYFSKMKNSDIFVYLDDVQFVKREFQNRNKIRTKMGWQYITIPVITKNRFNQLIKDVEINNTYDWKREHLKAIETNYKKSRYFDKYFSKIVEIYSKDYKYLIDISIQLIDFFREELSINTKTIFSSSLNINKKSTERIIEICKLLNADTYLSGIGAKSYLKEEMFLANNIKLVWQSFEIKPYPQAFDNFVENLSILDLIFNCGKDGINYL